MIQFTDDIRTGRRRNAMQPAVVLWVCAVLAQSAAPWLHALCAEATECAAERSAAAVAWRVVGVGDAKIVGHASGHPYRGTAHDNATCPLCRSLQHATVALAPVAVAFVAPADSTAPGGVRDHAQPRDRVGGGRVSRAPPAPV